jgi:hypothetical protein
MTSAYSTLILAAVIACGASTAYSQQSMEAEVPFAFTVRGEAMPAGGYYIHATRAAGGAKVITINGPDNRHSVTSVALISFDSKGPVERPHMQFMCGAKGCALDQIWNNESGGVQIARPYEKASEKERVATVYLTPTGSKAD